MQHTNEKLNNELNIKFLGQNPRQIPRPDSEITAPPKKSLVELRKIATTKQRKNVF